MYARAHPFAVEPETRKFLVVSFALHAVFIAISWSIPEDALRLRSDGYRVHDRFVEFVVKPPRIEAVKDPFALPAGIVQEASPGGAPTADGAGESGRTATPSARPLPRHTAKAPRAPTDAERRVRAEVSALGVLAASDVLVGSPLLDVNTRSAFAGLSRTDTELVDGGGGLFGAGGPGVPGGPGSGSFGGPGGAGGSLSATCDDGSCAAWRRAVARARGTRGRVAARASEAPKVPRPTPDARDPGTCGARASVRAAVASRRNEVRYCYERHLQKERDLEGKVRVRFVIGTDGRVERARVVESTTDHDQLERCISDRMMHWLFPKPDEACGQVVVTYPFVFRAL